MIFAAGERWEVSPTAWFGSSMVIGAEALKWVDQAKRCYSEMPQGAFPEDYDVDTFLLQGKLLC